MLSINIGMGTPASHADGETLNAVRQAHIKLRCFRLFAYLRNRGLNRQQCNEVRNRFESFLFDQLNIEQLMDNDEIAQNIRIGNNGFYLPEAARENVRRIGSAFFDQPEMKVAKSLCEICPSHFIL